MEHDMPGAEYNGVSCPRAADAAAWLAGEMDAAHGAAYGEHLASCLPCRHAIEETRRTLAALKTLSCATASRDLAPAVLARLHNERARAARPMLFRHRAWASAAALLLLLGGSWWMLRDRRAFDAPLAAPVTADRDDGPAQADAAHWLLRVQEQDGSWDADKWGGDRRFGPALTSLAVLALLEADPDAAPCEAAIRAAAGYLSAQQLENGRFGASFSGAPYNQGMATLALLRVYQTFPDRDLRGVLDKALAAIREDQVAAGGWGYRGEVMPLPNLSVTVWQIEALRLADELGWEDMRPPLRRALQWVAAVSDDSGTFGYQRRHEVPEGMQALDLMGALALLQGRVPVPPARREAMLARTREAAARIDQTSDYYQAYFLAAVIKNVMEEEACRDMDSLRSALVHRQERRGAEKGSWPPTDRWGSVGGRIYATSLASLALR